MRRTALMPEPKRVDRPGSEMHGFYLAKVLEVLPARNKVRVELDHGSQPIDAAVMVPRAAAANGWVWMPQVEELVIVGFLQGRKQLPVVLGSVYDDKDTLPTAASDVLRLNHQSGTSLEVDAAGQVTLDAQGSTITLEPNGTIRLEPGPGTIIELGGTVPVVRHGDSTTPGPGGHTHTVIATSTKAGAG